MISLFNSKIDYFLKCAQMVSFSEAAAKIGITQSTLSLAIKRLEEDLEAKLFERTVEGIRLTPTGEALMTQLQGFQKQMNKGVAHALAKTDLAPVKIGCVPHYNSKFLLPHLKKKNLFERLQLFIVWSVDSFKAVQSGEMDFAFVSWSRRPKELPYLEIQKDPTGFVGLKNKFPNLATVKTMEEIENYPLIHLPKPQYPWTDAIGTQKSGFLARDTLGARDLILGGISVGYVQLDLFSNQELKELVLAPVPSTYPHSHIYIVHRKDISTQARAFMEELAGALKSS